MKKLTLLLCLALLITSAFAGDVNFKMNGAIRTRMALWTNYDDVAKAVEKDGYSRSNIDSRLRWNFSANLDERIKAVWQVEVGDIRWGDGNSADIGTDGTNVETKHAYLEYLCPMSGVKARVGLQAWADHRSLIFDDDFAAIGLMHNINGIDMAFYFAKVEENLLNKDDDKDLFIFSGDMKQFGAELVFARSNSGKELELWAMPYATHQMDALTIDGMLALNYGSMRDAYSDNGILKDATNFGYAVALKAEYDMNTKIKADILYTSGDDGSDPESTSKFHTISSYYMNGLEILGFGIHDGWAIMPGAEKGDGGTITLALSANHPINDSFSAFGAFGMANYVEKVGGETAIGMEFNAGVCKKIYKPLSLKAIFAYMMAGDALGTDVDDVMKAATVLEYKF